MTLFGFMKGYELLDDKMNDSDSDLHFVNVPRFTESVALSFSILFSQPSRISSLVQYQNP